MLSVIQLRIKNVGDLSYERVGWFHMKGRVLFYGQKIKHDNNLHFIMRYFVALFTNINNWVTVFSLCALGVLFCCN